MMMEVIRSSETSVLITTTYVYTVNQECDYQKSQVLIYFPIKML
jgi:hypothetical protein